MTDIIIQKTGAIGQATLNRPHALNALTHQMMLDIEQAMQAWETDDSIKLMLIDASGDRAFCAGGDVVALYIEGIQGTDTMSKQFWREEYRINSAINSYPKPYVAIMDGIVMGGGAGVSVHGSHRIVTERTVFAMPECAIGLIPDVGGTYFLSQMPRHCGEYAGLTGARLSGADCIHAGLADYYVMSDDLPALKMALQETGDVNVISDFTAPQGQSALADNQNEIDAIFSKGSASEIQSALQNSETEFAKTALKGLTKGAPLAQMAALKLIRQARVDNDLNIALRNEYRFVATAISKGEFLEGVRAALIDKDRNPIWKYQSNADVPRDMIDQLDTAATDGDFIV